MLLELGDEVAGGVVLGVLGDVASANETGAVDLIADTSVSNEGKADESDPVDGGGEGDEWIVGVSETPSYSWINWLSFALILLLSIFFVAFPRA